MKQLFNIKLNKIIKIISITNNFPTSFSFNNKYYIIILFICIISSVIIRNNNLYLITIIKSFDVLLYLLILLSSIYLIYLLNILISRSYYMYKIIPKFIIWYRENKDDILYIIFIYNIKYILLSLLSLFIMYNIIIKLNIYIKDIYIYPLLIGFVLSIYLISSNQRKYIELNYNYKYKSYIFYVIIILLIPFYYLYVPFCVNKIINNEEFIKKCLDITLKGNYMDNPNINENNIRNNHLQINPINNPDLDPNNRNNHHQNNLSNKYTNLDYLSNVLNYDNAIKTGKVYNNWYYLDKMLKDNVLDNRIFKINKYDKTIINQNNWVNIFNDDDNINNNNIVVNNPLFTESNKSFFEDDDDDDDYVYNKINNCNKFILYKDYFINSNYKNKQIYITIMNNISNISFWSNYESLLNLLTMNHINKNDFIIFLNNLIYESIYQYNNNKNIFEDLIIDNQIILDAFEKEFSNKFIYLNGQYSIRLIDKNNYIETLNFKGYYWEGLLQNLEKKISDLKSNPNEMNNYRYNILLKLYNSFINKYKGVLYTDNQIIKPLNRKELFFNSINDVQSIYKINFENQLNHTFDYLDKLQAFIFKINNKPLFIDCNSKVTLSHYINDLYLELTSKVEEFIGDFNLYNKVNINKNNFDIIKDIISISDMNIDNDYTHRLKQLNKIFNKIKLMEKALKLNISHLDINILQNQNNIKLIPKFAIKEIEFPINKD